MTAHFRTRRFILPWAAFCSCISYQPLCPPVEFSRQAADCKLDHASFVATILEMLMLLTDESERQSQGRIGPEFDIFFLLQNPDFEGVIGKTEGLLHTGCNKRSKLAGIGGRDLGVIPCCRIAPRQLFFFDEEASAIIASYQGIALAKAAIFIVIP
jgi:hypothetical protein